MSCMPMQFPEANQRGAAHGRAAYLFDTGDHCCIQKHCPCLCINERHLPQSATMPRVQPVMHVTEDNQRYMYRSLHLLQRCLQVGVAVVCAAQHSDQTRKQTQAEGILLVPAESAAWIANRKWPSCNPHACQHQYDSGELIAPHFDLLRCQVNAQKSMFLLCKAAGA